MLRGNAGAKVDEKGRVKLPAIFRSVIESTYGRDFFVTSFRGEFVRIYPIQVYAVLEQRLAGGSGVAPTQTRLRTFLNYYGQPATMDRQGRVLIHPTLREKARINGEVAVLGQQTYLDVWNQTLLDERLGKQPLTDSDLTELAALGY